MSVASPAGHEHVTGQKETTGSGTTAARPVCSMITPETAAASCEADGVTYFCSAHCAASFDADPVHYTTIVAGK